MTSPTPGPTPPPAPEVRAATPRPPRPAGASFWRRHASTLRVLALVVTFFGALAAGGLYASWALVCRGGACPAVAGLEGYSPRQTSKLYAADERFVAEIGNERRTLVTLREIPPVVRDAFLVTEDKRFYSHSGVDWLRVPGATLRNVRARRWREGFSTITMQLARNVFSEDISREKTVVRKLREAKVAREIEQRYPKDKILELYLNQIYLGAGAYGVETAAQRYFGKSVRDLNLAEAATLAALPKGPSLYDPRRFPERAVQRRNTIVELMRREGVVNDADASLARAYPLQLATRTENGETAPYFVEWVRRQLEEKFGRQLYEDGLKVYTTLDVDMQSAAERALEAQLKRIEAGRFGAYRHTTFEQYQARGRDDAEETRATANSPYLQGAFVAVDPRTGAVRALVGGRDFDDSKFNRATQALRQPGSTFKPIVYAAAVQNGRMPASIVPDEPVAVPQADGSEWTPQNFDGKFEGPIPMRRALYLSRNLAAINVGMELGPQTVIAEARKFGLSTPIPPYPAIYLGSADVYPIEMVAAYSAFATLGTRSSPFAIVRVENQRGDVLWQPEPVRAPVLSPEEAYVMVSMMKDVNQRGTAYGAVWGNGFRIPSAGKTGTTNDGADVWYVGYTPDLVAGVWIGLDKPQKIKTNAQGGELAAPAWTAFMTEVYRRKPAPPDWPTPSGIVERQVVAGANKLYVPECGAVPTVSDIFIAGLEPVEVCIPGEGYGPDGYPLDSTGAMADTTSPLAPGTPVRPTVPFDLPPDSAADTLRLRPSPTRPAGTRRRPASDAAGANPALVPPPPAPRPSVPPPPR
ncbi:PBP1A family penicillin-binding protein [Roseisolibacter sp. H3M3-2]|uniref:penicillin-binding protein 1A n=1 Tax=Roseisolibacter sp. H3M3-2 TaxID=3031323 RepID=UPI0023DAE9DB|nr:PBP1A family penicillin-binding protein [Roseisolibacter sp. H3M3-2]MDF1502807.1 PBP1A family penicillin-binding protein [Roseisolibacter sp. H3M3-2]